MTLKKLVLSMQEQMIQTVNFYREMQTDSIYSEKYSDINLKIDLKNKAKAYNELIVNQFNSRESYISLYLCVYETIIESRRIEAIN